MKRLFDVQVSLLLDAESKEDAIEVARKHLAGDKCVPCNFMVHCASETDDGETLEVLRKRQKASDATRPRAE